MNQCCNIFLVYLVPAMHLWRFYFRFNQIARFCAPLLRASFYVPAHTRTRGASCKICVFSLFHGGATYDRRSIDEDAFARRGRRRGGGNYRAGRIDQRRRRTNLRLSNFILTVGRAYGSRCVKSAVSKITENNGGVPTCPL